MIHIGAHRHLHIYINEIGIPAGEESGLGAAHLDAGHQQTYRDDEYSEKGNESVDRAFTLQDPPEEFFIPVHQFGQHTLLETMNEIVQQIGIEDHQHRHQQGEIGHPVHTAQVQQHSRRDKDDEPLASEYSVFRFFEFLSLGSHKAHREYRVEYKGNDQGSRQCQDQYRGQVDHEFPDQSLPE